MPPAPDVENAVREILAAVRERGDDAVRELTERFDGARVDDLRVPSEEIQAAPGQLEPGRAGGAANGGDQHEHRGGGAAAPVGVARPRAGPAGGDRRAAGAACRRVCARRPGRVSVHGCHVRGHGACRRGGRAGCKRASRTRRPRAPCGAGGVLVVRRQRGLPDGRRPGGGRPRLRNTNSAARGRGRRARQRLRAGGQAPARGADRHRQRGRSQRAGGGGEPRRRS